MKFWTTPAQWRILKTYWVFRKPFTAKSLVNQAVCPSLRSARANLHAMEQKSQVYPIKRQGGKSIYVATTNSKSEWAALRKEKFSISTRYMISENCFFVGRNRYEIEESAQDFIAIIEKKKAELRCRNRDGKPAQNKTRQ